MLLALHEFTTNSSTVFVTYFVDVNSVVTAIERNEEFARFVIWFGGDNFRLEAEDMHILFEHFLHINTWRLRLQ